MRAAAAREDFLSAAAFQKALQPLRSRLAHTGGEAGVERRPERAGTVTLTLDASFDDFTVEHRKGVLRRLAAHGGLGEEQLVVLSLRAGSVILEVAVVSHVRSHSFTVYRACSACSHTTFDVICLHSTRACAHAAHPAHAIHLPLRRLPVLSQVIRL